MSEFTLADVQALEEWPTSRAAVARRLGAAIMASVGMRVTVESINEVTGEYRLSVRGTLDRAPVRLYAVPYANEELRAA